MSEEVKGNEVIKEVTKVDKLRDTILNYNGEVRKSLREYCSQAEKEYLKLFSDDLRKLVEEFEQLPIVVLEAAMTRANRTTSKTETNNLDRVIKNYLAMNMNPSDNNKLVRDTIDSVLQDYHSEKIKSQVKETIEGDK